MEKKSLTMFQRRRIWDNEVDNKRSAAVIRAGEYLQRKARARGARFLLAYILCMIGIVCFYFIAK